MGTKLVKLEVPDHLHTRIKTLAASQRKQIKPYMIEILEKHVPRVVRFPERDNALTKHFGQKTSEGPVKGGRDKG